jgi:hypothetical protein
MMCILHLVRHSSFHDDCTYSADAIQAPKVVRIHIGGGVLTIMLHSQRYYEHMSLSNQKHGGMESKHPLLLEQ